MSQTGYQLVQLLSGAYSIRSLEAAETFHPVVGPVAEAEALYVNQLKLRERLKKHQGEFVIWDVGLGAAANPLTVLKATREMDCQLRIVSFDHKAEPLEFALKHTGATMIALLDHTKFGRRSLATIARSEDVDIVVTDELPSPDVCAAFERADVRLVVVSPAT